MNAQDYVYSQYGTTRTSKDNRVVSKILPKLSNEQWYQLMEEYAKLNKHDVSGMLPTDNEIDLIIEQDLPFSKEYQKYSEKEKTLMLAATKAGAKWFRSSMIEGNYR